MSRAVSDHDAIWTPKVHSSIFLLINPSSNHSRYLSPCNPRLLLLYAHINGRGRRISNAAELTAFIFVKGVEEFSADNVRVLGLDGGSSGMLQYGDWVES